MLDPGDLAGYDSAGLTATEEQAVRLMEDAGLVERRLDLQATMDGRPEAIEFTCVVSGEKVGRRIWELIFQMLPGWLDEDGRTRGRVQLECRGVQIRLSDQGEIAKHDYENQTPENPSCVCAFVRRLGFVFAHRRPVTPTFRVESCRVDADPPASNTSATAAAAAQATVGDITINNVIQMDESAVVERILAAMNDRATPPVPVSETPAGGAGNEGLGDGDAAAEAPSDMKPAVRRPGRRSRRSRPSSRTSARPRTASFGTPSGSGRTSATTTMRSARLTRAAGRPCPRTRHGAGTSASTSA